MDVAGILALLVQLPNAFQRFVILGKEIAREVCPRDFYMILVLMFQHAHPLGQLRQQEGGLHVFDPVEAPAFLVPGVHDEAFPVVSACSCGVSEEPLENCLRFDGIEPVRLPFLVDRGHGRVEGGLGVPGSDLYDLGGRFLVFRDDAVDKIPLVHPEHQLHRPGGDLDDVLVLEEGNPERPVRPVVSIVGLLEPAGEILVHERVVQHGAHLAPKDLVPLGLQRGDLLLLVPALDQTAAPVVDAVGEVLQVEFDEELVGPVPVLAPQLGAPLLVADELEHQMPIRMDPVVTAVLHEQLPEAAQLVHPPDILVAVLRAQFQALAVFEGGLGLHRHSIVAFKNSE